MCMVAMDTGDQLAPPIMFVFLFRVANIDYRVVTHYVGTFFTYGKCLKEVSK